MIDNRNIDLDDLRKDGIQVLEKGKVKLARNFLNNFYWQSLCKHSSHTDTKLDTQTSENICYG